MERRKDQTKRNCQCVVVDWQRETTSALLEEVCLYLTEAVERMRIDADLN